MINGNDHMGEVLGASIKIQRWTKLTPPEGLCPFGRSVPARHQLRLQALAGGSPDRTKKEYTLCELCASVVRENSTDNR